MIPVETWIRPAYSLRAYSTYDCIAATDKVVLVATPDGTVWYPRRFFLDFDDDGVRFYIPKSLRGPTPLIDIDVMAKEGRLVFDYSLLKSLRRAVNNYNKKHAVNLKINIIGRENLTLYKGE